MGRSSPTSTNGPSHAAARGTATHPCTSTECVGGSCHRGESTCERYGTASGARRNLCRSPRSVGLGTARDATARVRSDLPRYDRCPMQQSPDDLARTARRLATDLQLESVLDAGSGSGVLVEKLLDLDVDASGLPGTESPRRPPDRKHGPAARTR